MALVNSRRALSGSILALRPVLGAAGASRCPVTTAQRRTDTTLAVRVKQIPAVQRFRKWYGFDEPLFDLRNYPNLPDVYMNELPTYGWQDNFDRRNLNTLLHDDYDLMTDWNFDSYAPDRTTHLERRYYPLAVVWTTVAIWVVLFQAVRYYMENYPESVLIRQPMVSKDFPHGNLYIERGGDMRYPDGYFPSGPPNKNTVTCLP